MTPWYSDVSSNMSVFPVEVMLPLINSQTKSVSNKKHFKLVTPHRPVAEA